jgi:phosphatidate cytidylyltransferase
MSPQAALQSEVYLAYVAIVGGILVVAGAAIAALRWGWRRNVAHAAQSYRAWLVIVPAVALIVFLGREAVVLMITSLALAGIWEFARATGLQRDRVLTAIALGGTAGAGLLMLVAGFYPASGYEGMFWSWPALVTAVMLLAPIVRNRAEGELHKLGVAVLGFVYIGWMFAHLALLANTRNAYGYLSYLLVAVELNDVAAYVCGRLLGRHVLRGNISPKKTWDGALGACGVSLLLPWLLWFSFPDFGAGELILTGLIVGVGGQLGDLAMSIFKRDVGVKDMGSAIPGHGGVLDRIDSMIYVAPLFYHLVHRFHHL